MVSEVRIFEDRTSGRSLGYAYVEFSTGAAAAAARVHLAGRLQDGVSLTAVPAHQPPRPGMDVLISMNGVGAAGVAGPAELRGEACEAGG